jgi:hypothetical protein
MVKEYDEAFEIFLRKSYIDLYNNRSAIVLAKKPSVS